MICLMLQLAVEHFRKLYKGMVSKIFCELEESLQMSIRIFFQIRMVKGTAICEKGIYSEKWCLGNTLGTVSWEGINLVRHYLIS